MADDEVFLALEPFDDLMAGLEDMTKQVGCKSRGKTNFCQVGTAFLKWGLYWVKGIRDFEVEYN